MEYLISEKWFWIGIWSIATLAEGAFIYLLFAKWLPIQDEIDSIEEVEHDH